MLMQTNVYSHQNWQRIWLWRFSQNIFVFHPRAILLQYEWGPNWAQTICGALWMCCLAETSFSFFFSYLFLFFSAGKWWRSSDQWSQVSLSYKVLLSFFVCAQSMLTWRKVYYTNITQYCVCMPACAWACLYLVPFVSPTIPSLFFLVPRCFSQYKLSLQT